MNIMPEGTDEMLLHLSRGRVQQDSLVTLGPSEVSQYLFIVSLSNHESFFVASQNLIVVDTIEFDKASSFGENNSVMNHAPVAETKKLNR